ncbi:MAG: phosphoribosylformylglycinamidine synthase subunit PurL [Chitinophagales bacterium]|nr:MAG: phosphoribosylformylglycinamidine synthase subunit PurL [Chitinophagales bacterium]
MQTDSAEHTVTVKTATELGLLPEEFDRIQEILGRVPNFTELSVFSVMWSEHCSYKNSLRWLKTLPRQGDRLLAEAGQENAGLVDIGNGLACAFKIESHNHPSAIEPYQGAATGVGGIHRDIFTMGARPVAALNSLRFGNLKSEKTRHLLQGVVKGIGDYGNSFGVPTVAGEIYFEDCYEHNPLVNAMSVGIVSTDKIISAAAIGAGNPVYIVGSATGKDGIHGATFASGDIHEDSHEDLPAVQVGDPFQEKLLLEATQELLHTEAVIGMQDMGAAGIACSTSEMSARGKHGMRIWLHKVPTRQPNMKPWEILLSESQERMLLVVRKGHEQEVEAIFDKWDLHCALIGEVTDTQMLEYYMYDELVACIPAEALVVGGGAPVYEREFKEPAYFRRSKSFHIDQVQEPTDLIAVAKTLISSPNIASKRWIYEQYDSMVGIDNISTNAPSDAAIIRLKHFEKALALTVDCNARYVYADPYKGGMIAVCEAARNIVCSGGLPVAITNCLNFGNPYNPEVYWQFVHAVRGMGEACRKLGTPVTGGNVSFYNQSEEGPVYPTPTIGMLGILDHVEQRMTLHFKNPGDIIYMLGQPLNDINCSEYLQRYHQITLSPAPAFDLEEEILLHEILHLLIKQKAIVSAHDVSEGGLFAALAESGFPLELGFEINVPANVRRDAFLFGESQSRVVVTVTQSQCGLFERLVAGRFPALKLGTVTTGTMLVDGTHFGSISEWKQLYETAIERCLL